MSLTWIERTKKDATFAHEERRDIIRNLFPKAVFKTEIASDDPAAGGCPPVTPTVGPFGAPVSRPF